MNDYPSQPRGELEMTKLTNRHGLLTKAGAAVLAGTLVLSGVPVQAIAETTESTQAEGQGDTPPDMPEGEGGMGGAPDGAPGGEGGFGGGANTQTFDYDGTFQATVSADGTDEDIESATVEQTSEDSNVANAQNGGTLTIVDSTLTKSGEGSDADDDNFYGVNSIVLAVGEESTATVLRATLEATSTGSNAIFSTDGATVYAYDTTISTTQDNSRGLDATYGGTIVAANMAITTQGSHSASVATDRGGGSISLVDSSLSTAGSGSPLLYSTGDIEVSNVTGTATGSQIAGMEGLNTILIADSTLESTNEGTSGSDPVANGVIIYQSTSGDAETATGDTATFQAARSSLTSAITSGAMFYLTNTSADIVLADTDLDFDTGAASLLIASGNDANSWGTQGENGATVRLTGIDQVLEGAIEADGSSSVDVYLTEGTKWTGYAAAYDGEGAVALSDGESSVSVSVDSSSTWVVTSDCTVASLTVAEGGTVVDTEGNAVTIVDASGSVLVEGEGDTTVTVAGDYGTDYDSSAAGTLSEDLIDRSGFDEWAGTSTSFSMTEASDSADDAETTDGAPTSSDDAASEDGDSEGGSWWDSFVSFWLNLFGIGD